MIEYTIITYGAGEILNTLFNAIATLVNSRTGSLYQPLVRLGLLIGLLFATLKAIYGNQLTELFRGWMLPFYLILILFFAPTCRLHIKDPVSHQPPYTVDNVPLGLGMFAGTISKISDSITRKIEAVFSLPDDLKYHKTGAVFASNLIAESKTYHITDVNLIETMREFINQCIVYDALLGIKYTIDDLLKSPNLWNLVIQNPSPARCFTFKAPGKNQQSEIVTCKAGVEKMRPYLEKDIQNAFQYFGNKLFGSHSATNASDHSLINSGHQLKSYLPIAFDYMGKMANSATEIMQQQMMIYSVVDALENKSTTLGNAPNFAVRKAYLQQRVSQQTVTGLAAQKLIAIKNILEALIYVSFIFVLAMAMLPAGWKFIAKWAELLVWINLWPPLYAILNAIMNMAARNQSIGQLTLNDQTGITIANSVGFMNLHADMAAQAGYLSFAVGSIAYAIIKGGSSGFMHLASSMSSPALSAASNAAESLITGNYSFGNVSQGTLQANNSTFGQQQWSPQYSAGSFTQNDGTVSRTTSAEGSQLVNVSSSNLRSSINLAESMTNAYTEQAVHAAQVAETQLKAATQADGEAMRHALDLSAHQARQESSGLGYSLSESAGDNQSFTRLNNLVDRFAQDHGITREKARRIFGSLSGGGSGSISLGNRGNASAGLSADTRGGVDYSKSKSERSLYMNAQEYMNQDSFQNALQQSINAVYEQRSGITDDEGKRYVDSINAAHDQSQQLRSEASINLQKSESYSQMASMTKQNSSSINANLNQEYVDWLHQQSLPNSSGPMGIHEAATILSNRPELDLVYQRRFLESKQSGLSYMNTQNLPKSSRNVEDHYDHHSQHISLNSKTYMTDFQKEVEQQGYGSTFSLDNTTHQVVLEKLTGVTEKMENIQNKFNEKNQKGMNQIKRKLKK